jgi:hypothetical protein
MRDLFNVSITAVIFVFTWGCASTAPLEPKSWSTFLSIADRLAYQTKTEIPPELKEKRLQYIDNQRSEYQKIMDKIDSKLDDLRRTAEKNSTVTLWTGGAGIASGVAATTLVVASPANAVWVAGLTAFGTGVMTFQTRAALEGYSRDAVARVYNEIIAKIQDATSQIGVDFEFLRSNVESTGDVFDKRAGELDQRIIRLHTAAILTPLIVGTDQDIEELKRRNVELQSQIDEIKKKTGITTSQ